MMMMPPTFRSPLRKIRIPMAALEETHNPKRVEEDRGIAIEVCVCVCVCYGSAHIVFFID